MNNDITITECHNDKHEEMKKPVEELESSVKPLNYIVPKVRGRGCKPTKNSGQVLMTHDLVEGDIRMKRAIFRKAVKVFKKNVIHQNFKINEMTFQDCLRLALYEEFPTPG